MQALCIVSFLLYMNLVMPVCLGCCGKMELDNLRKPSTSQSAPSTDEPLQHGQANKPYPTSRNEPPFISKYASPSNSMLKDQPLPISTDLPPYKSTAV